MAAFFHSLSVGMWVVLAAFFIGHIIYQIVRALPTVIPRLVLVTIPSTVVGIITGLAAMFFVISLIAVFRSGEPISALISAIISAFVAVVGALMLNAITPPKSA